MDPWPCRNLSPRHGTPPRQGDTDRRLALIGFDNSVEVCIDAFIGLHPRLRGGYQISKTSAEAAVRNYHSKIEFLEEYLTNTRRADELNVNALIWYHQLRNALYHSGNGMTPELHVVEGARDAARTVFSVLFGFDPSPSEPKTVIQADELAKLSPRPSAILLATVTKLEEALEARVPEAKNRGLEAMWQAYRRRYAVPNTMARGVQRLLLIRSIVAHGQEMVTNHELETVAKMLPRWVDFVEHNSKPIHPRQA